MELVCVIGLGALAVVLWRNWVYGWAVARKLIIEAMHRRVAIVLLIFFVVLTFSLPFILKTEGSLKSQTQLLLLYSLVLGLVLLCVLAIFISAASICSEIERKQVQITDTKPLARWQFLLGKWFGVVVMCTAILSVMAAAAGAITKSFVRPPDIARMLPPEAAKALEGYIEVQEELFVARRAIAPRMPSGAEAQVQKSWDELAAKGELPGNEHRRVLVRTKMREEVLAEIYTVPAGYSVLWQFDGLRPGDEVGKLFVRFTAHSNTPDAVLMGTWAVLKREVVQNEEGKREYKYVTLGGVLPPQLGWQAYTSEQFEIPARYVPPDGTLFLRYDNYNTRAAALFGIAKPVEILQTEGAFWPNYYRVLLVLMCHVALLAALGLMAGSVFSFPVASLTVVFIFIVGLIGPWFVQFLAPAWRTGELTFMQELPQMAWRRSMEAFLAVMPHFGKYNPLGELTDGRTVTWSFVASAGAVMVFIKGTAATLIGMYFYARRELARVIV